MGIEVKMRKVVGFVVWLFSLWTWKDFFLRWIRTRPFHVASGESAGAEHSPCKDSQEVLEFERFFSSLPEGIRFPSSIKIHGSVSVELRFGTPDHFRAYDADCQEVPSGFLGTVASSKFVCWTYSGGELCLEHVKGFSDALRRSGFCFDYFYFCTDRGTLEQFGELISRVLEGDNGFHQYFVSCFYSYSRIWANKNSAAQFMTNFALPGTLRNMKSLDVSASGADDEGMEELLKPFQGPHCGLKVLRIFHIQSNVQVERVSRMVASSTSLEVLYLTAYHFLCPHLLSGYSSLATALCSNQSLRSLHCDIASSMELKALLCPFMPKLHNLQPSTSVINLDLRQMLRRTFGTETLPEMLRANNSLLNLTLRGYSNKYFPTFGRKSSVTEDLKELGEATGNVLAILEALKTNVSLKRISFENCDGLDGYEVLGCMMDMLLENHCIEDIELKGTGLERSGDAEYVRSTLSKRKKMKFWDIVQGMTNVSPSSGRVFLCGQPYAGKTRLRMSMNQFLAVQKLDHNLGKAKRVIKKIRDRSKAAEVGNVLKHDVPLERTRGIEVDTVLCGDIAITIWDMAGQPEYHSFHELVMPNLSADGSSSMFLLVCNPMEQSNPSIPRRPEDIKCEMESWLRFVASNTRRSFSYPPHVSMVMTYFDYWKDDVAFAACIEKVVMQLKLQFREVLDFDKDKLVWKVDGRNVSDAGCVFDLIKSYMMQLLATLPKTLSACEEVRSRIAQWNADKSKYPLLKWDEFCEGFCKEVEDLNDVDHELANRRKEFVAMALNDGGHIIYNEEEKVVTTNPRWFCHDIMGQFQDSMAKSGRHLGMVTRNGSISRADMKCFILELIKGEKHIDQRFEQILGVLKKLNICYEQDPEHIIIPSTLDEEHQSLRWSPDHESRRFSYVGRRLACKDRVKTMLTPIFFTRLQASFFVKLQNRNGQKTYRLFRDIIKFISDGIEVIVQFNDGDIDILLRSGRELDEVLQFLDNGIVMHIKHLQMDTNLGCPGVVLEDYILRPICVRELINCKDRKNQFVHIKDLEDQVIKRGDLNTTHDWESCTGLDLGCDKVKTLVGSVAWKGLLQRRSEFLQEYYKKVQVLSVPTQVEASDYNEGKTDLPTPSLFERLLMPATQMKLDLLTEGQKEAMSKLNDVLSTVIDIRLSVEVLEDLIWKMEGSLLREVCSRIDVLMAFSVQMQKSQIPKLAYLCQIGSRRLLTRVVPGLKDFQLHLMCESRDGFHEVGSQRGCVVHFGSEHTRRFLGMFKWGLKIATVLTKIGAHVACGMGEMVPDFSKFAALFLDTPGILDYKMPVVTLESLPDGVRNVSMMSDKRSEAEEWLTDFLQPRCEKKKEFYEKFKLRKVHYKGSSGAIAWICDACIAKQRQQIDEL